MNYRHAFHAGNFADVIKHIVLTRILLHLHQKPAAFRVIDTHAGAGLYDLTSDEAQRGQEWQAGIGRLTAARLDEPAAALLKPYLDIVGSFNTGETLTQYPGSPLIARALMRPQDRLAACELEPGARKALIRSLNRDAQARVVDLDGWLALSAFVPPNERRGLVLVDPPFERPDEFDHFSDAFSAALAKWSNGIFMLWYPAKNARTAGQFAARVARAVARTVASVGDNAKAAREKCLRIEFDTGGSTSSGAGLTTAGLLVVNPPWTLKRDLTDMQPALAAALGHEGRGHLRLDHPAP